MAEQGSRQAPRVASRYGAAILACGVAAAALPALGFGLNGGALAPVGVAGGVLALGLMLRLVRPLASLSRGLRECLGESSPASDALEQLPANPRAAGGMVGDLAQLLIRTDVMRRRLTNQHPVTQLPTREPFLATIADDIAHGGGPIVLGVVRLVDYDRLAAFDREAAETALAAFAAKLRGSLPRGRPLAHVDRDCFAVWFSDAASREAASRELQALSYVLGQELAAGELKLTPNIEIGAAVFPEDGGAGEELLTRAIAALELGELGAKPVAFFSAEGSAAARERFALEQDLRGAATRDELLLHYQPVVDMEAGRIVGAEALLRWRHPTGGLLYPSHFVGILEQSPMMAEVGLWVLNAACREASVWRREGVQDVKVAVNLSARQCRDIRLNEMVMRTLQRHALPSSSLELELTETAAMEDAEGIRRLLGELRAQGVSVAIDDFGAGYSSLSYLKNLPFSKLKIDREFVTDVDRRRDSRAICAALVRLAEGLGISVLAEGVERYEEMQTLRSMGCRLFQGYLFARPMEGPLLLAALRDPRWLERLTGSAPTAAVG